MKHIYDKDFVWVPSHKTNVKETFERIKREQEQKSKVTELKKWTERQHKA